VVTASKPNEYFLVLYYCVILVVEVINLLESLGILSMGVSAGGEFGPQSGGNKRFGRFPSLVGVQVDLDHDGLRRLLGK
jgi:hypothetical protein